MGLPEVAPAGWRSPWSVHFRVRGNHSSAPQNCFPVVASSISPVAVFVLPLWNDQAAGPAFLSSSYRYLTYFVTIATMSTTTSTTQTRAEPITAETILRLFPDIDTSGEALEGHDEEQIRLMDEVCIVLDENDMPIGKASKKVCRFTA